MKYQPGVEYMKKSVVIVAGVIVLLALLLTAFLLFTPERRIYAQPGAAISKQELESADLAKIATRGLRDRGIETKCAMVKLDGTFPDGSYRVVLVLRNGREMKGRLYKERNRLKIAVDVISVFES